MLQKRNKNNKNKTGLWKKYSLALDLCVYCADVRCSITWVAFVYKYSCYYRYCHSCYFWFLDVHNSSLGLLCTSCFLQYLTLVVSCIWFCAHVCCARAQMLCISSLPYCNWQLESILHRLHIHIPRKVECLLLQKFLY